MIRWYSTSRYEYGEITPKFRAGSIEEHTNFINYTMADVTFSGVESAPSHLRETTRIQSTREDK